MINPTVFLIIGLCAAALYAVIYFTGTYITRRNKRLIAGCESPGSGWIYDQTHIRRRDRLLPQAKGLELLAGGEYGVLSMITPEGLPYGVPLNYVYDGTRSIYIHCAPEGKKLQSMKLRPAITFTIVGHTHVISRKFTTAYESIIATCSAITDITDEEKSRALSLLLDKYCPDDKETGMMMAEKSFNRTAVVRLDIHSISGKAKVAMD